MPMVFVHGVNTRSGDTDAQRKAFDNRVDLLREQFRVAFADRVTAADGLKVFAPYWGDLGATFRRDLACLPHGTVQALAVTNPDKAALLSSVAGRLDAEIARNPATRDNPVLTVAKARSLAAAVDLLFTGAANAQVPSVLSKAMKDALPDVSRFAAAAERYAADNPRPAWLDLSTGDQDFAARLFSAVNADVGARAASTRPSPGAPVDAAAKVQTLGIGNDVLTFLKNGASAVRDVAATVVDKVSGAVAGAAVDATRVAFMELAGDLRPSASIFIGRFFGDVFAYLENRTAIQNRVLDSVRQAKAGCRDGDREIYLVGHSFGGIILYDILTTCQMDPELTCDLYVTVGSQVALFAEIDRLADHAGLKAAFDAGPKAMAPRPAAAARWINIFDLTDFVGFGTKGVFGGVWDYRFDTDALPLISHSAYFDTPRFFARLRERANEAFATGTDAQLA